MEQNLWASKARFEIVELDYLEFRNSLNKDSLVVFDLDGTLINCTAFRRELKQVSPLPFLGMLIKSVKEKRRITRLDIKNITSETSPIINYKNCFNPNVEKALRIAEELKCELVIATAATGKSTFDVFRDSEYKVTVLHSTNEINLKGQKKGAIIKELSRNKKIHYFGNSRHDYPLFELATYAYMVGSKRAVAQAQRKCNKQIKRVTKSICTHSGGL